MCWVALDRLLWLASAGSIRDIPRARFERERDLIRDEVERRGFNAALGSYTQVLDGDTVDASLLLLDRYGYVRGGRRAHAQQLPAHHAAPATPGPA